MKYYDVAGRTKNEKHYVNVVSACSIQDAITKIEKMNKMKFAQVRVDEITKRIYDTPQEK
jgi:hypothetical protein